MPTQPLQAFPSFSTLFPQLHLPSVLLSPGIAVTWTLYVVFAFWAIYTVVAIYHWLKYSNASWLAFPAIALHLSISFALMLYALSGHGSFLSPYLP